MYYIFCILSKGNILDVDTARFPKIGSATAVLNKKTVTLEPNKVTEAQGCEHPAINRKFTGRKYEFTYVIGWLESLNKSCPFANALTKVNLETGETLAWRGTEFCYPSEAVFIPRTPEILDEVCAEDDGIIVASVTNVLPDERDFLIFLDARTMSEIGRAMFDESIPFASHAYLAKYDV